ncbi:MAG: DUF2807 domain-containing protein [Chitinophagaceae bacterium]|nr:DUF2807 domain-containing protein [Chitinophagaceae bacterium]
MKQFFFGSTFTGNKAFNISWLLFRFYIGFSMALGAGWPKMKDFAAPGWFADQVRDLGFTFPSPAFWAAAASWGEFVGGLFIAIGFLTRISAIQLAFQFFIVAFIWYGDAEPVTGMYYQQLLFWGFVLISFGGSGRFAVDEWIMKRKKINIMPALKPTAVAFFLFAALQSTAQNKPLNGSGKLVTQTYDYSNFNELELFDLAGDIEVEIGKSFSVSVTIDDNLKPLLNVEKKGSVLRISIEGNKNNKRYLETTGIRIRITMPAVTSITHSSNSRLVVKEMKGSVLRIKNSGNGDAMVEGTVGELNITCYGNGDVKADQLIAEKVNIEKTGNGDVLINTGNIFTAKGYGNGNIVNKGKGKAASSSSILGNGTIETKQ